MPFEGTLTVTLTTPQGGVHVEEVRIAPEIFFEPERFAQLLPLELRSCAHQILARMSGRPPVVQPNLLDPGSHRYAKQPDPPGLTRATAPAQSPAPSGRWTAGMLRKMVEEQILGQSGIPAHLLDPAPTHHRQETDPYGAGMLFPSVAKDADKPKYRIAQDFGAVGSGSLAGQKGIFDRIADPDKPPPDPRKLGPRERLALTQTLGYDPVTGEEVEDHPGLDNGAIDLRAVDPAQAKALIAQLDAMMRRGAAKGDG